MYSFFMVVVYFMLMILVYSIPISFILTIVYFVKYFVLGDKKVKKTLRNCAIVFLTALIIVFGVLFVQLNTFIRKSKEAQARDLEYQRQQTISIVETTQNTETT